MHVDRLTELTVCKVLSARVFLAPAPGCLVVSHLLRPRAAGKVSLDWVEFHPSSELSGQQALCLGRPG